MKSLFTTYTMKWWEISILKLNVVVFGIWAGTYWSDFFSAHATVLFLIFGITLVYLLKIWWRNVKV